MQGESYSFSCARSFFIDQYNDSFSKKGDTFLENRIFSIEVICQQLKMFFLIHLGCFFREHRNLTNCLLKNISSHLKTIDIAGAGETLKQMTQIIDSPSKIVPQIQNEQISSF